MFRKSVMFRFHTGSIKRTQLATHGCRHYLGFDSILVRLKAGICGFVGLRCLVFRFHTGSIKSHDVMSSVAPELASGFDSILVRLKAENPIQEG